VVLGARKAACLPRALTAGLRRNYAGASSLSGLPSGRRVGPGDGATSAAEIQPRQDGSWCVAAGTTGRLRNREFARGWFHVKHGG